MEMIVGALLLGAGFAAGHHFCLRKTQPQQSLPPAAKRRRMQLQLENFLNYDGTERGQKSLAEREFSEGDL